jgi:hypothetical protein
MTNLSPEDLYRKALEEEDGDPVSAGARIAHVKSAIQSGLALYVNLSAIPAEKRPAVIAEINDIIKRAESTPQRLIGPSKTETPEATS